MYVGLLFGICLLFCWSFGLPWASQAVIVVQNPSANAGNTRDTSSISGSGWGRSIGEGNGNALWYSCLENPMDRGAWQAAVHSVAKSQALLQGLSTHTRVALVLKNPPAMQETLVQGDILKKGIATDSSILAWRSPCTEEPGRLQSMGSQRVGQDWVTNTFTFNI